ncbi:hypothetical protein [Streptomyces spirodelae]|uniref:Uncharacterized protein n=1 Tax=Streptomyces spirodelae TaxID=2812904 RepID=A0ABS3WS59_9ACTN|nr:hypothetical protein [Streptomyces spirodelae]MBO8185960.1 hypothetical protein [Streptomyces spirodelae]
MGTTSVSSPGGGDASSETGAAGVTAPAQSQRQAEADPQAQQAVWKKKEVWVRMVLWLLLSVVFALLPTGGQYLNGRQTEGFHQPGFWEWVSRAQLYVVSMGLAVAAVGEALMHLWKSNQSFRLILVTVTNVLIMLFAAYLAPGGDSDKKIEAVVGQQSLVMFITVLVTSGISTWLCVTEVGVQQ